MFNIDMLKVKMQKQKVDGAETEQEKFTLQIELEIHHHRAEAGQKAMAKDSAAAKSDSFEALVMSFDMHKKMYVPKLTHSQMYYSRQLTAYNLVCILKTHKG